MDQNRFVNIFFESHAKNSHPTVPEEHKKDETEGHSVGSHPSAFCQSASKPIPQIRPWRTPPHRHLYQRRPRRDRTVRLIHKSPWRGRQESHFDPETPIGGEKPPHPRRRQPAFPCLAKKQVGEERVYTKSRSHDSNLQYHGLRRPQRRRTGSDTGG